MPKDKDGNFHSAHGKPSGFDKSEGTGMQATPREDLDEYNRLTDEYLDGPDEVADGVREMNPNRNTEDEEAPYRQKEPNPMRDRTLKERDDKRNTSPEVRELPVPVAKGIFKELASYQNDHCVTLLLNTHQSGVEVNENQDAISFKNAVKKAEELLQERGADDTTIQRMLSPAFDLINDTLFWKSMKIGFAVFISPDRFDYMKLNKQPGDRVVVEKTFYVTPLLRLILDDTHYYVLDLSKGGNRFFKGNKFALEEMKIENMPGSIMDEISDRGVSIVYRYDGQSSLHGYGDGSVEDDVYLRNYLKRVDTVVTKQLQDRETPLILSGAQPVTTMYRNESSFKTIADETLEGNNQHKGENELFKEVLPIAEKFIKDDPAEALEEYGNLSNTDKTSDKAEKVISASYYGKIKHLFVKRDAEYWGRFDEMKNEVTFLEKETAGSEDLVDNAVVNTIMNGGEVHVLEEQMPNGSDMAAVFRY